MRIKFTRRGAFESASGKGTHANCSLHGNPNRGSAILVVLLLLACMALLIYANSKTLYLLDEELKLLDQRQQKKYGQNPSH